MKTKHSNPFQILFGAIFLSFIFVMGLLRLREEYCIKTLEGLGKI